jgi:hypothetical protein
MTSQKQGITCTHHYSLNFPCNKINFNIFTPNGVYILRSLSRQLPRWSTITPPIFISLLKKRGLEVHIHFRFLPLETTMLVVAVTAHVPPRHVGGEYARLSRGDYCATRCLTFVSMHASVFIAADSPRSYAVNINLPL